ncbi:MAG: hypothetical protein KJ593_06965 [Candidatus Omnitrophica bacterium]|nr:hypothetical protein [Candidatus Omnitrophota bacterium]
MIVKILGWLFIIWGIVFFLKPEWLKNKLLKKTTKKVKRYLFALAIVIAFLFIVAGLEASGLWAKVFMLFAIVAIIKAFLLLKGKATDRLLEWFSKQPVKLYKSLAVIYIIMGIIFLKV